MAYLKGKTRSGQEVLHLAGGFDFEDNLRQLLAGRSPNFLNQSFLLILARLFVNVTGVASQFGCTSDADAAMADVVGYVVEPSETWQLASWRSRAHEREDRDLPRRS